MATHGIYRTVATCASALVSHTNDNDSNVSSGTSKAKKAEVIFLFAIRVSLGIQREWVLMLDTKKMAMVCPTSLPSVQDGLLSPTIGIYGTIPTTPSCRCSRGRAPCFTDRYTRLLVHPDPFSRIIIVTMMMTMNSG